MDSLEHGQKKVVATSLGVHATTISRWCSGDQRPSHEYLARLCQYFGLPAHTNLSAQPVFLIFPPISSVERKAWLSKLLQELDADTLDRFYPAIEHLLWGKRASLR
jgi:transcriptional regulator with XRE-family HTH domain